MRLAAILIALTAASAAQAASLSPLDDDPATLGPIPEMGATALGPDMPPPLGPDPAVASAPPVRLTPPAASPVGGLLLARDDPGGATLPLPVPAAR